MNAHENVSNPEHELLESVTGYEIIQQVHDQSVREMCSLNSDNENSTSSKRNELCSSPEKP